MLNPNEYVKIQDVLNAIDNADLKEVPMLFRKVAQNNIKEKLQEIIELEQEVER